MTDQYKYDDRCNFHFWLSASKKKREAFINNYAPLMTHCQWVQYLTLTFNSVTQNRYFSMHLSLVGEGVVELLIGNGFSTIDHVTLTFESVTPKWIRFLCYSRWMCVASLQKVGQGQVIDRLQMVKQEGHKKQYTDISWNI